MHYVFEMDEILSLEADVEVLHSMCLEAVDHVVTAERFRDFALPEWCWEAVAASWRRSDPHVYGRFDLRYDGSGPAKLLEYNADTPTTLLEASILQWYWLKDVHPDDDQWNSLHEKLVERWRADQEPAARRRGALHLVGRRLHRRGPRHRRLPAGDRGRGRAWTPSGWPSRTSAGTSRSTASSTSRRRRSAAVFKLYPWEWVLDDDFGKHVARSLPETLWVEPLWKSLLSQQGAARRAVGDVPRPPQPASRLPGRARAAHRVRPQAAARPRGREHRDRRAGHRSTQTGGVYGEEGYVYQLFDPLPEFDGFRPALGAWIVGDTAAGLGIRETVGLVTDDGAAFVPHRIPDA